MVLAEAFMKRNDLKKEITELTQSAIQNLWQDKELPIDFDKGTKIHPGTAYEQAIDKMRELKHLNIAIADANQVNSETLRDLETTTAEIALVEQVLGGAARYPGDKVKEREYVGNEVASVTHYNEWLIDAPAVKSELIGLKNHKRDLEKQLAHSNFITEVDFA